MSPTNTSWRISAVEYDTASLDESELDETVSPSSRTSRAAVVCAARPRSCPASRSAATAAHCWPAKAAAARTVADVGALRGHLPGRAVPAHLPTRGALRACTSTRSTTPARRWSSCRTGATACRTRSTSTPIRTSPSTAWPWASRLLGNHRVSRPRELGVTGHGRGHRATLEPTGPARLTSWRPALRRHGLRRRRLRPRATWPDPNSRLSAARTWQSPWIPTTHIALPGPG